MITIKQFEKGNFKVIHASGEHPVVTLLRKGRNAYTAKEIAKLTKMESPAVRSKLSKLIKKGIVKHISPYYAILKK